MASESDDFEAITVNASDQYLTVTVSLSAFFFLSVVIYSLFCAAESQYFFSLKGPSVRTLEHDFGLFHAQGSIGMHP